MPAKPTECSTLDWKELGSLEWPFHDQEEEPLGEDQLEEEDESLLALAVELVQQAMKWQQAL